MSGVIGIHYTVAATSIFGGATASPKNRAKKRGAKRKP
jgi:hypothetical protein